MMDSIHLRNFTAFSDAEFTFADGLNVIVGENGTEKTHVLKAAYSLVYVTTRGNKESGSSSRRRRTFSRQLPANSTRSSNRTISEACPPYGAGSASAVKLAAGRAAGRQRPYIQFQHHQQALRSRSTPSRAVGLRNCPSICRLASC